MNEPSVYDKYEKEAEKLYEQAKTLVLEKKAASIAMLQIAFHAHYLTARFLYQKLKENGVIK